VGIAGLLVSTPIGSIAITMAVTLYCQPRVESRKTSGRGRGRGRGQLVNSWTRDIEKTAQGEGKEGKRKRQKGRGRVQPPHTYTAGEDSPRSTGRLLTDNWSQNMSGWSRV
jgi:hypothetical protein